jgi:hypothetical protein
MLQLVSHLVASLVLFVRNVRNPRVWVLDRLHDLVWRTEIRLERRGLHAAARRLGALERHLYWLSGGGEDDLDSWTEYDTHYTLDEPDVDAAPEWDAAWERRLNALRATHIYPNETFRSAEEQLEWEYNSRLDETDLPF